VRPSRFMLRWPSGLLLCPVVTAPGEIGTSQCRQGWRAGAMLESRPAHGNSKPPPRLVVRHWATDKGFAIGRC